MLCHASSALLTLYAIASVRLSLCDIAPLAPFKFNKDQKQGVCLALQNGTMLNNAPFYVRATDSKKKGLILCLHSKSGSTTWKTLIFASIDPGNLESYENPHLASHVFRPNLMPMHGNDCNRKIPRITIVRNPYSRLLSCFKDKILSKNQTEIKGSRIAPDTYSIGGSFAEFVHATVNSTRLNPHLTLQTSHCNLQGSVYDYALHIEEIDVWFKPVLRMLGQDIHNPRFVEDGHIKALNFHGADETITEYYTQDLAETVSFWAASDLTTFKYPAWNHTMPLVSIYPGFRRLA